MNKPAFSRLLFSTLLALTLLVGFATPVSAEVKPRPVIKLTEMSDIKLGDPFTLAGTIKDHLGRPVPDKTIQFLLDGKQLGQARTNESGRFQRKFTKDLNAGTYTITAVSNATHLLDLAVATTTVKILPAEVRIQTVPAVSGVPFQMNGERFVSDQDGLAIAKINTPGLYRLEVLADQYHNPSKRIEFARWLEESYEPFREIEVPTNRVIQVGLDIFHEVGQSFLHLDGSPVDPKRISEFTIRSAQGDMFVLHDGQQRWIPASRVARRITGLEETKLLYSVLSVTVDGSNVVNQAQQRFYTYPHENWPISLLLYSLRISAKDGLFGSSVGKSVNLEFPDGRIENYPLDEAGMVEINSLARGTYYIELVGANGLKNRIPVALSRNQDVSTKVITHLDLGVAGLLGIILALGLLLYGRPTLLPMLRKKYLPGLHIPVPEWSWLPQATTKGPAELYDYRNLRFETVKVLDDQTFLGVTGVDRDIFEKMLAHYQKKLRKAGKQPKLSGADQILLTLLFLREHRSEFEIGHIYGVSESTVRRTIKRVKNTMLKSVEFDLSGANLLQTGKTLIEADLVEAAEQPTTSGAFE